MCLGGHVARVEVQAGDGIGALGLGGLLLDGDGPSPRSNSTTPKRSGSSTW